MGHHTPPTHRHRERSVQVCNCDSYRFQTRSTCPVDMHPHMKIDALPAIPIALLGMPRHKQAFSSHQDQSDLRDTVRTLGHASN